MATLAQVPVAKRVMNATASGVNANLQVVDDSLAPVGKDLHGTCLADFAVTCGNLPGVSMWAPVQDECSMGSLDDNIDQTMFLDETFVNSLEFSYTNGSNATENYGAETDNKTWLLNSGRFINYDSYVLTPTDIANGYVDLTLDNANNVAILSTGVGFLRKDENGSPAVSVYDDTMAVASNVEVVSGAAAVADSFVYATPGPAHRLYLPTASPIVSGNRIEVIYSADGYGSSSSSKYFELLNDNSKSDVGALRQGQVEVYIVAKDDTAYEISWRLTGCTISSDLTREPLSELGHLSPYDRPLTLPIPINITVDATAGDLENWAKVADKLAEYRAHNIDNINLSDLMSSEDLKLVVKVYAQTDEEANGSGDNRKIASGSSLIGKNYFNDGVMGTYTAAGEREYPLKTLVVEHLKITDEGMTLDMGSNATQTFGFRSTNDLYVVKGNLSITNITGGNKVRRKG